ncbi:MAG TPA: NRDE family protein [Chondromyces sp.]|nr:NRDE family protein [Chondromyces sp.]
MCLINFQLKAHPRYKLVIAANRDEFYGRPTARAAFWPDAPHILAGRDLHQMGTWLGISKKGRFAALTNYREPANQTDGKRSRGEIVTNFLQRDESPEEFLMLLKEREAEYQGFNVLVGSPDELFYYGNRGGEIQRVMPGIHALSNALLDTPWPKVEKGRTEMSRLLSSREISIEKLFSMMENHQQAPTEQLPETGVSLEWEQLLSPMFIKTENYGTKSSTVLLIDQHNEVTFVERTYHNGKKVAEVNFQLQLC